MFYQDLSNKPSNSSTNQEESASPSNKLMIKRLEDRYNSSSGFGCPLLRCRHKNSSTSNYSID